LVLTGVETRNTPAPQQRRRGEAIENAMRKGGVKIYQTRLQHRRPPEVKERRWRTRVKGGGNERGTGAAGMKKRGVCAKVV